eukprot:1453650-Rhodomonas_salina.3
MRSASVPVRCWYRRRDLSTVGEVPRGAGVVLLLGVPLSAAPHPIPAYLRHHSLSQPIST